MPGFQVGIAQVDYTPLVGLPMMGNLREDYASTGVHDPLFAKAAVFSDPAGRKVAVMSMDICMVDRDHVRLMRELIASQCDITAENILIAATHIHSGPATIGFYTSPKAADEQIEALLTQAARAVVLANEDLTDATLRVGYGSEDRVSFYRRLKGKDGQTYMNFGVPDPGLIEEPLGEIDPQVTVLSVESDGRPKGAIVNFSLHPAVLDYGNSMYSGEYPGYLAEALRKTVSDDFQTLFFNGCCGNVNHIDYQDADAPRRGYAATQRIGYMLAASVRQAMDHAEPVGGEGICLSGKWVELTRLGIDEETYEWSKQAVEEMKIRPPKGIGDGLPREYSAPTWVEMYERQHESDRAEVMAVRIGDVALVGLPGEVFCELGREIKQKSPARHTFVFELANDAIGYLPTPEAFEQGGYEPTPGATRYEPDAGQRLAAAALDRLRILFDE